MITVQFTVRPGQGDPSGFDLGDMSVTGGLGTADSAGRTPDQGMMIYLSVTQLLDSLRAFLSGHGKTLTFTGVDTSFSLVFRRTKDGISVAFKDGIIARTASDELASAVLGAAESLSLTLPPGILPHPTTRTPWQLFVHSCPGTSMAAVIDVNRGTVTGRHVFTRTLSEATEDSSPDARAAWSRLRRPLAVDWRVAVG
ncbi:hypothetical protein [Streptomyces mirabilis]|uniref:hypothetical protein n=1 Tax=Streptomyces mirabilis TaxID=68239 RepID=UPI0031BAE87A